MGQFDNQAEDRRPQPSNPAADSPLRLLKEDLEALRHKIFHQLSQDVAYLESRKQRLMGDIEALEQDFEDLKHQHQQLQQDHDHTLTQQQQAQQQLWAKRLAQALATHLHARLQESLQVSQTSVSRPETTSNAAQQQVAALDATIHSTLQTLEQDLTSYRSHLSQQIHRMQSIEQQGEAILEALVTRLSQQLQTQMVRPAGASTPTPTTNGNFHHLYSPGTYPKTPDHNGSSTVQLPPAPPAPGPAMNTLLEEFNHHHQPAVWELPANGYATPNQPPSARPLGAYRSPTTRLPNTSSRPSASDSPVAQSPGADYGSPPPTQPIPKPTSTKAVYTGLVFMVLSTLALSMHNVLVGIIGYGGLLLGRVPIQEIFTLDIPNSLMLLWLRMVFVLPLLMLIAVRLYPPVWKDMRHLFRDQDKRPLYQVIASGSFLFMSQVLIYKAIADVGPGVAVTLLFMYPLITVPLAWFLFGDRPTPLRLVVMFAISMGIVFTALPRIYADLNTGNVSLWGVGAAILSSVAFALFLIAMQLSFRRLHPVPVSLLQFSTIFILTSVILILGSFVGLNPGEPTSSMGLYVSGFLLGLLTLMGYLFNNYGVKLMGAAQASIVASSGPVITAILAYVITPGEKSALSFIQWMGVVLVTLGVVSLSLERLNQQQRLAKRRQKQLDATGNTPAPH